MNIIFGQSSPAKMIKIKAPYTYTYSNRPFLITVTGQIGGSIKVILQKDILLRCLISSSESMNSKADVKNANKNSVKRNFGFLGRHKIEARYYQHLTTKEFKKNRKIWLELKDAGLVKIDDRSNGCVRVSLTRLGKDYCDNKAQFDKL